MPQGPFISLTCGSPHFQWECKVDFFQGHCFNYLYGELGFSCPCHTFQVLNFCPFLLEAIGVNNFGPFPFPNVFEINMKASSPKGCDMCVPL